MNSTVKSTIYVLLAAGAVLMGLKLQKDRELKALEEEYTGLTGRGTELAQELKLARAKLETSQQASTAGTALKTQHEKSLATIAEEQKKISALMEKWPALDAERVAAVKAVREKESTKPPATLILADGTKLENMVVRSVPDEKTVSIEHSSGLVKIAAANLPAEMKERLGLGWAPEAPAQLEFDRSGNAVFKKALQVAAEKEGADETARELAQNGLTMDTMAGLTRALASVEAQLTKAKRDIDEERQNIRRLDMFKSDLKSPNGKSYGILKKEANARLVALAGRLRTLQGERGNIEHKIKSF